jgi:hypothetical protein
MKCGLQIMLEIDVFGNNDIHSLHAFVTKVETQLRRVLLIWYVWRLLCDTNEN